MSTKEKILDAALTLFAENGYDGTSVEQIANIVGIKAPSLYKHYRGKEEILNAEALSLQLITLLQTKYPGMLDQKYTAVESEKPEETLKKIAENRGCQKKGNEIDYSRAERLLLDDFRNGRIGRVSLETP